MMHTTQGIYDECRRAAVQIEQPDPNAMYKIRDRDGAFLAAPLIAAKANLLSSMAVLKASSDAAKLQANRKRGGW